MKTYMAYAGESEAGAVLVFAHNIKEAKRIGFPAVSSWCPDAEYIDMRVSWLKDCNWLFEQADKAKLDAGIPHVIEDPISCKDCEKWGMKLNEDGVCESCATNPHSLGLKGIE